MHYPKIARRRVLVPFLLAAFVVAPAVYAEDDWADDDGGWYDDTRIYDYQDEGWATGTSDDFESSWWEDEEFDTQGASYEQDDYGTYDSAYDWNTDETWWNDWWE